jgi:hypothetical protein
MSGSRRCRAWRRALSRRCISCTHPPVNRQRSARGPGGEGNFRLPLHSARAHRLCRYWSRASRRTAQEPAVPVTPGRDTGDVGRLITLIHNYDRMRPPSPPEQSGHRRIARWVFTSLRPHRSLRYHRGYPPSSRRAARSPRRSQCVTVSVNPSTDSCGHQGPAVRPVSRAVRTHERQGVRQ